MNACSRIADYSVYFNSSTRKRKPFRPFLLKEFVTKTPEDDAVYMAAGFPNKIEFPVVSASFQTRDGTNLTISPQEMQAALQYGPPRGKKSLLTWIEKLVKTDHSPPTMDNKELPSSLDTVLCCGAREGLSKCLHVLLEDGDCFLSEEFIYQTVMHLCQPHGIGSVAIRSDDEGLDAGHLKQVLTDWNEKTEGRRPRLLYVVPTCSNPTGITWSERRKREIYDVTRQFNLLILEDDPYYYLQTKGHVSPSLLSMDVDGRVIRVDSFTKTISSGVRVGIIHGPKAILDQLVFSCYTDNGGPSQLSQMLLWKVLEKWGIEGFKQHAEMLANFYKGRTDSLLKIMDKHLKGLAEWRPPEEGMFVWLKIPGVDNPWHLMKKLMERGVFVMDAEMFSVYMSPAPYLRLCTSLVTDQQMERGIKIIAELLREVKGEETGKHG